MPTVIITGPPWPRSGTGRVIQSQIQYYRSRGFQTVLIAVPFRWNFVRDSPVWDEFRDGLHELGADHTFLAAIEPKKFRKAKYSATLRHGLRGTALDWMIAIAGSAQVTLAQMSFLAASNIKLLQVNHVFTLEFARGLRRQLGERSPELPLILDTHDIQSHVVQEKQELNPWTKRLDSEQRLIASEIKHLQHPDVLVHLSSTDFSFFERQLPARRHFLILPTIDPSFVASVEKATATVEPFDLLMVADWHAPNLAAVQWLFERIWPLIVDRNYALKIVGRIALGVDRDMPELYTRFRHHFVGEVSEVAPFYKAARCVIAPMISGSGISIKTVEAFASGKAFVGTSKALRGMPVDRLKEMGIGVFDEPDEFGAAVVRVLESTDSAERASRSAYEALFSTKACFALRDEAVAAALEQTKGALQRV